MPLACVADCQLMIIEFGAYVKAVASAVEPMLEFSSPIEVASIGAPGASCSDDSTGRPTGRENAWQLRRPAVDAAHVRRRPEIAAVLRPKGSSSSPISQAVSTARRAREFAAQLAVGRQKIPTGTQSLDLSRGYDGESTIERDKK
uniref:Uncharacterized protein n=1 Tax=Oryza punctata TaxID=4537 RepID=A0A0E0MI02_ORYPU